MPSELVNRLRRYLDQHVASDVMALEHVLPKTDTNPNPASPQAAQPPANAHLHWPLWRPDLFGTVFNPQSVVIHETSGWPSFASANRFSELFRCVDTWEQSSGNHLWYDKRGIGPQYFVDPHGTAFNLIGPQNLAGDARYTGHAEGLNSVSLGIENADAGDSGVSPNPGTGPHFFRLPKPGDAANPPTQPNVPGRILYALIHPDSAQANFGLIWFAVFASANPTTPASAGDFKDSADLANRSGWQNMIFTERNYRSLALLCRLVAEQYGIPRNFLLLPYSGINEQSSSDLFRKLFLSYERQDLIATKLGLNVPDVQANNATFTGAYTAGQYTTVVDGNTEQRRPMWGRFFGWDAHTNAGGDLPCFRGFISHNVDGNHNCPGPFFDWHRLAREVWDWWWYPFDFAAPGSDPNSALSTTRRPYNQARHTTPLIEYFWEAQGLPADYNAKKDTTTPPLPDECFKLATEVPIYAMANGVVVAARMELDSQPLKSGFLLVRHEVFNTLSNGLVNYDVPPLYFWSLTTFLDDIGFTVDATSDSNPDWLNRFVLRLLEAEAAVVFHNANLAKPAAAQNAHLNAGWAFQAGTGDRLATGQEIERDANSYRQMANDLVVGNVVLFPLEANSAPTPVRVILGDFLGFAYRTGTDDNGIQIEIFSKTQIADITTDNRVSAWAAQAWWKQAASTTRHEGSNDQDLPLDGMVWHYKMTDFLKWVNNITWLGERKKYGWPDPVGTNPVDPPVKRNVT
jgi:hypothetical protein